MRQGCPLLCLTVLLSTFAHFRQYLNPTTTESRVKSGVYSSLTEKDMRCSEKELRKQTTLRCPSRDREFHNYHNIIPRNITDSDYRQNYTRNMISVYNGIDKNLFRRCTSLPFPLQPSDPPECWPLPVILPSYPTSGNGLFRSLLSELTVPLQTSMVMYDNPKLPTTLFRLDTEQNGTTIQGLLSAGEALPLFRRVVVFKSHLGGNPTSDKQALNTAKLRAAVQHETLHGILRLARNPGDQLLRNYFRWNSKRCYDKGMECFMQRAHRFCPAIADLAAEYDNFHRFWKSFDTKLPQHVSYYEHFTSKEHAANSVVSALKFLNTLSPDVDYERFYKDEDRIAKAIEVIREPSYEHGKILVEVCGKDVAREVHEKTKGVTKELGYVFDYEDGTWSLEA